MSDGSWLPIARLGVSSQRSASLPDDAVAIPGATVCPVIDRGELKKSALHASVRQQRQNCLSCGAVSQS